jgi:hypothetical protein
MAETVVLQPPITPPAQTDVALISLTIDLPTKSVFIQWKANTGVQGSAFYSTPVPTDHPTQPTGSVLLTTLNKKNFSGANPSMVKAVYNQLIADGYLTGTVSGVPD